MAKDPGEATLSVAAGQEQQMFDAMSLSAHPDAASVLSLIGKGHPDKRIAEAARRSAYWASSRSSPASGAGRPRL